jgi:hypothetical protein
VYFVVAYSELNLSQNGAFAYVLRNHEKQRPRELSSVFAASHGHTDQEKQAKAKKLRSDIENGRVVYYPIL